MALLLSLLSRAQIHVFADHFKRMFERIANFDSSVLDLLPQEMPFYGNDGLPSDIEIARSISHLHATSLGAPDTPARLWQVLASNPDGFNYIRHFITHFWIIEDPPKRVGNRTYIYTPK